MVNPWVRKFFGVPERPPTVQTIINVLMIGVVASIIILLAYIAIVPKEVCAQFRTDVKFCHQTTWHGMTLEGDLLNYTTRIYNYGDRPIQYALLPEVYFAADQNKTAPTPERVVLSIAPGQQDIYRFYGQLDQGRWVMKITIQNATSSVEIYNFATSIFIQPRADFYNALVAFGTLGGLTVTVSALLVQAHYSKKQIKQDRAFRNEEKFAEHSHRIGKTMHDGCEAASSAFASCSYSRGNFGTRQPERPDLTYWPLAEEHFKAYARLWAIREAAIKESNNRCIAMGKIFEEYKSKVMNEITTRFPGMMQIDENYFPKPDAAGAIRAFVVGYTLDTIFAEAWNRGHGQPNDSFKPTDSDIPYTDSSGPNKFPCKGLLFGGKVLYYGNKEERNLFQQAVTDLMNNPAIQGMATNYHGLNDQKGTNELQLEEEIRHFMNNIDDGVQLLGSCKNCKGLL